MPHHPFVVANNNILVLNSNSEMQIQDLHMRTLKLGEWKFLKEIIPELNESFIVYSCITCTVLLEKCVDLCYKSNKSANLRMIHLITTIEHDLKSI